MTASSGGPTVAITGGSSGLGARVAKTFAGEGCSISLMARREDRLQEVVRACREEGASGVTYYSGDVTDRVECEAFVQKTRTELGPPDVAVANAGRSMWAPFHEVVDPDRYRELFEVNYMGTVNLAHAVLPDLLEREGSFVAVTSIQAKLGVPNHTFYAASKHAVDGFCRSLRAERPDLHVMTVFPHWIRGTELRDHALKPAAAEVPAGDKSGGVSVERCALALYEGYRRRKREVYVPGYLRWVVWLYTLVPSLVERVIRRRVRKEETS